MTTVPLLASRRLRQLPHPGKNESLHPCHKRSVAEGWRLSCVIYGLLLAETWSGLIDLLAKLLYALV